MSSDSPEDPEHAIDPAIDPQVTGGVDDVQPPAATGHDSDHPAAAVDAAHAPTQQPSEAPAESDKPQTLSLDDIAEDSAWTEHADDFAAFKQGDMLASVPLSWTAPAGVDPLTGLDSGEEDTGPVVAETDGPVIICSQTCDLGATPPGDKHPLMLVAPIIHESAIAGSARLKLATSGKLDYLIPVLPPEADTRARLGIETQRAPASAHAACSKGERWFADLRMLMPVSKALLIGASPVTGFVNEDEHLQFAEYLAQKFRRPALDERLSESLPRLLKQYVTAIGKNKQAVVKVEQVRLLVSHGNRLVPARVQLLVLTNGLELTDSEQDEWAPLNKALAAEFGPTGLTYAPLIHQDVKNMSAETYRDSVPVRCELLRGSYW